MTHHLANYTLHAMLHLSMNEFTTPERQQKVGVMVSVLFVVVFNYLFFNIIIIFSFGLNGIMVFFYYTVVIWLLII
jgi:hypothetical protein